MGEIVVAAGGGRIFGPHARVKVPTDALEGRLFAFEGELPPGQLIPPHVHTNEDEVTIVRSGSMTVDLGGRMYTASAGSVVVKPRGIHHAMWNHTGDVCTVLELHVPGGMEPYYEKLWELFASQQAGNDVRPEIQALQDAYGITFLPHLTGEIVSEDGARPQPR
jgi:quercetin dioxygenase-like cupin family protein